MDDQLAIVILAAGAGTRMESKRAKVLHAAGGRTLIEHSVATARAVSGGPGTPIYVVVGHQAAAVMEVLECAGSGVRFIHQKNPKGGTGDALRSGQKELQTAARRLMVFCGDTPLIRAETLRKLLDCHLRSQAAATVLTADMAEPARYGRIVRGTDAGINAIVEANSASPEQLRIREINTGVYCFETQPLFAELERVAPDSLSGEVYLTDVISLLRAQRKRVAAHKLEDASEASGINTRIELAQADAQLRKRKACELMLAGVTIFRPETVQIDCEVTAGIDTVIEPSVFLLGCTKVGENCHIGPFSVIRDSEIESDVRVRESCVIEESKIARGSSIGPFARLRPETEIGSDVKIGNFVEIKKSHVGRGTRAGHLSYLGDAVIGENVNVGAGTITCNYDGEKKNSTIIGNDVFVGSNSALVAPVRVGDNSYVAAGSTITEEVPPDSLGIARGRQVNKLGWVRGRKRKIGEKR